MKAYETEENLETSHINREYLTEIIPEKSYQPKVITRVLSNLKNGVLTNGNITYDPCTAIYLQEYLMDIEVQQAMHIINSSTTIAKDWQQCNGPINQHWPIMDVLADTTELYSLIYNHPNKPKGFKMMIFSGDSDGVSKLCV